MTTENGPPPIPEKTGDSVKDSQALHAWDAAVRAHFEGRGPSNPDLNGNISRFDQEMRAAGTQRADAPRTGEVDQRALDFLDEWRSKHPHATPAQLAIYERDLAQVLEGRVMGETPEQFEARKTAARPTPTSTPQSGEDIGFVDPATVAAEAMHGYQMPDIPPGVTVHAETLSRHLAAARSAGISQEQVAHVIAELAAAAAV